MFSKKVTPFTCIIISMLVFILTFVGVNANRSVAEKAVLNQYRDYYSDHIKVASDDQVNYQKLTEILDFIDKNYVNEYDKAVLWDNIFRTISFSLGDKYSFYFNKEENAQQQSSAKGTFVGIGVRVTYHESINGIYIYGVVEGSPAYNAGIQKGDIIIATDSVTFKDGNYRELLNSISGKVGSSVTLKVLRQGKELSFTVNRAVVNNENVLYQKLNDGIAYICIYSFYDTTFSSQFTTAISKAQADGCTKYIFDLRNNSGGYLEQVCKSLDILLPKGTIINIVEAGKTSVIESDENCITSQGMVVLCNGETASAAELFTAALRDYKLAEIVGETTYGKGSMQTQLTLSDGGMFKITTAYYNPPSNLSYDGIGINPDYAVAIPKEWEGKFYIMPMEEDPQLNKAISILNSTN